ncbi:MAG: HD domain-containing protein [Phycisphaerae bacterium]|nr:HD domain-containing protein [Phycisphaerae bacterium]
MDPSLLASCERPADVVLDLLDDILCALLYIHQQHAIHSDVKEANILVRQSHRPEAVLVDLGAAHVFTPDHPEFTTYIATRDRVSEEWQAKVKKKIPSLMLKENRAYLDLYMFGAMLKLLLNERLPDSPLKCEWQPQVRAVLNHVIYDGVTGLSRIADKCLEGAFSSADDVRAALATSGDRLVSPLGIPELSLGTQTNTSLAIPGDSVPLTKRMRLVLNHHTVQRLRNTSQLDFVSMIYLGATHNRLLHSVETYNLTRRYLGVLLGDPTFRLYCAERPKLEATLLAGFLHDLGHYPLGHVFEDFAFRGETDGPFAHIPRDEEVTSALLDEETQDEKWVQEAANRHREECKRILRDNQITSLPSLIRQETLRGERFFGGRVLSFLRRILSDEQDSDEGILILRSIVSGPLDVDKLCYLRTDSRFTGAAYGSAVDVDSILASLTCTAQDKPTIAITEKGICAAESVATGRRWMYQRVYWHRTNRAIMAMLRFVPQYLLEHDRLSFPEYFGATYSMSDIEAVRWLNEIFEKRRLDRDLENPALMLLQGRRGIYKSLLEFNATDTGATEVRIREYLMDRRCAEWSILAAAIAEIAQKYAPEAKLSDVLIDIPSKRRHEIGDPFVGNAGSQMRRLSELSPEFRATKIFFQEGALSCRVFVHPSLRESLMQSNAKPWWAFWKEASSYLAQQAPR